MTSRSSVAPGTTVIRPSNSASLATLCSRQTATTSCPRSSAYPTMWVPSLPDAPTMQTLMMPPPAVWRRPTPRAPASAGGPRQREAFALAPRDGEQRDRHADAADEGQDLEQRAQVDARVAAAADDEACEHLVIQRQRRDGDEGNDHEDARDPRDPARRRLHGSIKWVAERLLRRCGQGHARLPTC